MIFLWIVGYNDKDLVYAWRASENTQVTLSQRLAIPQFTLVEWQVLSRNDSLVTGISGVISLLNIDIFN